MYWKRNQYIFVLKLSPCLECKLASFGYLPGVQFSKADVSEPSVSSIFKAGLKCGWIVAKVAKVLTGGGDLREAQVERPPVC